ncbi:MAG: NosD domain-containing protein, partial [Promethearchaeota archaeon]
MKNKIKKRILYLSLFSISLFIIAMFIQSNISLINSNINGKIISDNNGQKDDDGGYNLRFSGYENPIAINGSATGVGAHNWTWAVDQPWCTGDGTENDPYIIEDLIINGEESDQCIAIYNSIVYFIIRNCTVYNSNSTYQDSGIKLYKVENGKLINNYCLNNSVGIRLNQSSYNNISGNDLYNNTYYGIRLLDNSTYNLITENNINMNLINGIEFYTSDPITLKCKYNVISKNNISNNDNKGLFLDYSDYNNITQNIIKDNGVEGMHLRYSNLNLVFKNYFLNNPNHAEDEEHPIIYCENYWNNSLIGNYWDNHSTGDANGDGIDDNPYTYIPGNYHLPPVVDYLPIYGNPFHNGEKIHIDGSGVSGHNWTWTSTRAWCSGSGASDDPYIISDLIIDAANDGSCILIGNSSDYFKIENCTLINSGSSSMDAGIKLDNVVNSELIGNNCSDNYCGICLNLSDNNDIMENTLQNNYYGIRLNYSDSNTISENNFVYNTENALQENSVANIFENNYCTPSLKVNNVTSTKPNGTYRYQDEIEITIQFSDSVYVTGNPQLTLETDVSDAIVDYTSGNGTDTLSFNYTVELDDYSSDLDYISTNAVDLNGGTIDGIIGNSADLTLPLPGDPGSLSYNKDIVIDAKKPSITGVTATNSDGSYGIGAEIYITITFSEAVYVTG